MKAWSPPSVSMYVGVSCVAECLYRSGSWTCNAAWGSYRKTEKHSEIDDHSPTPTSTLLGQHSRWRRLGPFFMNFKCFLVEAYRRMILHCFLKIGRFVVEIFDIGSLDLDISSVSWHVCDPWSHTLNMIWINWKNWQKFVKSAGEFWTRFSTKTPHISRSKERILMIVAPFESPVSQL